MQPDERHTNGGDGICLNGRGGGGGRRIVPGPFILCSVLCKFSFTRITVISCVLCSRQVWVDRVPQYRQEITSQPFDTWKKVSDLLPPQLIYKLSNIHTALICKLSVDIHTAFIDMQII